MSEVRFPDTRPLIRGAHPTPLVPVQLEVDGPKIWSKLEFLNPSGSIKDRIARHILEKAWRQRVVEKGTHVVEASSGSTSIAMALVCAQMELAFTAVMPVGVSDERQKMIRAFGGNVVFTPKEEGIQGALDRALEISKSSGAFYTRQFENPDNPEAHRLWTGQEVLAEIPGGVVHGVVSGVGTGGTILGLHQAFVDAGCPVVPFVARPTRSGIFGGVECCSFSQRVPGVIEGVSKLYANANIPELVELEVADELAIETTRLLMRQGFPVGPSSGLNIAAAIEAARRLGPDAQIVTVFPDRMERYFSTELFQ